MFEDKRIEKERLRDLEAADKRRTENTLALGFLKTVIRPMLAKQSGVEVGLAGLDSFCAELLVKIDGVTYKLTAKVDHDE